jgi:hypothetical protein
VHVISSFHKSVVVRVQEKRRREERKERRERDWVGGRMEKA